MPLSLEEWEEEEKHRRQIVHAIRHGYQQDCLGRLSKYLRDWRGLSAQQQALCPEYLQRLHQSVQAVANNAVALSVLMSQEEKRMVMEGMEGMGQLMTRMDNLDPNLLRIPGAC